ncbi:MAG: cytidine deaminase [Planctomycetales bacterium]|nr:cytidine deaminase [Planctomycetales bacterium]
MGKQTTRLDQKLIDAAIEQATIRFPTGCAGAAAIYTSDGEFLTSVCFDCLNESANLCHETGAICEANRRNYTVTALVCVSRESPTGSFFILTPCGICKERLARWGFDVEVAVPHESGPTQWIAKTLSEVQRFYWGKPGARDGLNERK